MLAKHITHMHTTLRSGYYYQCPFVDEEMEAQGG